jgi:protein-S-isoprenylcysteine O-methyltransferase Ste14
VKYCRAWLAVLVLAVITFILVRIGLRQFHLDVLFREQIAVHTPGRSMVVLAVVTPFALVLLASLLTSAAARASTAVAYSGSWLIYASLLSQALLAMSGAFLLIFPLVLPVEAMTRWLHPDRWYLPVHYTSAHEPVVVALISLGFALIVIGLIDVLKARRHHHLATEGLYAIARHPQHLGIVLWTLGFALWGASPIDLIFWFIVSYVFVCLGIHEEGTLVERPGSEYQHYQTQVRFMPPLVPIRGPLLPRGGTGKEIGIMGALFLAGIALIMLLFGMVGVSA